MFLHHTAITYGAAGSWYYSDPHTSALAQGLLTLLAAYDQSWFMGFLLFRSGYLSIPSYARKGAGSYVLDRLVRFGIPLLVYALVISPVTVWLAQGAGPGHLSLLGVYVRQRPPRRMPPTSSSRPSSWRRPSCSRAPYGRPSPSSVSSVPSASWRSTPPRAPCA